MEPPEGTVSLSERGNLVDIAGLKKEIERFADRAGVTGEDDRKFAAWFTHARLSWEWSPEQARKALTDVPDGGVDAVFVQDKENTVYLIQTKLRKSSHHPEDHADVAYLTRWAGLILGSQAAFNAALVDLAPLTIDLLRTARERVRTNRMSLAMQFVTTGMGSRGLKSKSREQMEHEDTSGRLSFEFLEWEQVSATYEDFMVGVRRVPQIEMSTEPGHVRQAHGGKELGICLVRGDELAKHVGKYREIIFAQNIRGHAGASNKVNEAIAATLDSPTHASEFPYLNNGITILCDSMDFKEWQAGKWQVTIDNPQIVNGQQTAITLSEHGRSAKNLRVLLKVIEIKRATGNQRDYEQFIGRVVRATNFQTPVPLPDFHSNDWNQVEIERLLHRAQHFYARKVETKRESKRRASGLPVVSRAELGDAVGGCLEESLPYRETKDVQYTAEYYERIFDVTGRPEVMLAKVYVWRLINSRLSGRDLAIEARRGKWLVLFELSLDLKNDIPKHANAIVKDGKKGYGKKAADLPLRKKLLGAIDRYGEGAAAFFQDSNGTVVVGHKNPLPTDATNFFKTPKLHKAFRAFLVSPAGLKHGEKINKAKATLKTGLASEQ